MTRSIVLGHVLVAIVSVAACGEPAPPVALTMTNGQGEIAGEVTTTSVILQTRLTSRGAGSTAICRARQGSPDSRSRPTLAFHPCSRPRGSMRLPWATTSSRQRSTV